MVNLKKEVNGEETKYTAYELEAEEKEIYSFTDIAQLDAKIADVEEFLAALKLIKQEASNVTESTEVDLDKAFLAVA